MTRIKKVSIKDEKVRIEWETSADGDKWNEFTMVCVEKAVPEFYDTLAALASHAVNICEFQATDAEKMTVLGVSFSYGGDEGIPGATITTLKRLAKSTAPLVVNTPHKPYSPYSEGAGEENCMPRACIDGLDLLCGHAVDFINGTRAQMELPLEGEEPVSQEAQSMITFTSGGKSATITADSFKKIAKVAERLRDSVPA